jgi:hypothetical protein
VLLVLPSLQDSFRVPKNTGSQIAAGIFPFPVMEADNLVKSIRITRPLCDQAHQIFGREASPHFDAKGVWNRQ